MKKVFALVLVSVLLLALLTGCSGKSAEATTVTTSPASVSGKTYTIGYLNWGQGIPILDSFEATAKSASDALGNKFISVSDKFTADQQLTNVQNMISSGVDAIMIDAVVPTLIPDIAKKCADAKIPFIFYDHAPSQDAHAQLLSNPYYIGSFSSNVDVIAPELSNVALKDGNKTAVFIAGAVGDPTQDISIDGFTKGFEDGGGNVLAVTRCTDPTEAPAKAEDMLSANRQVDTVLCATGDYTPAVYTASMNLGITPKIYAIAVDAVTLDYIKEGKVTSGYGGVSLMGAYAYIMIQNYLDGNQFLNADGKAPQLTGQMFFVTKDNADLYKKCFLDSQPLVSGEVLKLCGKTTEKMNMTAFEKYVKEMTLDSVSKTQ